MGFYTDNEGQFKNYKIEEFASKLGIKVEFNLGIMRLMKGIIKCLMWLLRRYWRKIRVNRSMRLLVQQDKLTVQM